MVSAQVGVGHDTLNHKYRIDLVVEGMQGRLAVECDGDRWHGPDQFEYDVARQRDLERVGWQFVRIRGSDFYRDPIEALVPLWDKLDYLGIRTGGIDDEAMAPPSPVDVNEIDELVESLSVSEDLESLIPTYPPTVHEEVSEDLEDQVEEVAQETEPPESMVEATSQSTLFEEQETESQSNISLPISLNSWIMSLILVRHVLTQESAIGMQPSMVLYE